MLERCYFTVAGADVERVKREVEEIIGLDCSDAIQCSAKMVGGLPPECSLGNVSSCHMVRVLSGVQC